MKTIFALREKKEIDEFWRHKKKGHLPEILYDMYQTIQPSVSNKKYIL